MIDTHAHLSGRFGNELLDYKIDKIILAASSLEDSKDNLELIKKNDKFLAAVGIHPQNIDDDVRELEKIVKNNLDKIVAIGECGLEFLDGVNREKQIKLFVGQIELAVKYDKPLIIHSRKANDEILEILGKYNTRGVIHCYTGGKKRIKKFMELGEDWFFGIDGNITYEIGLEEVVREIPKDRLVLETDSPFLTPVPHRGEDNNPENIKYVYDKIADIWKLGFEETEKVIDNNAYRLFKI